MVHSTWPDWALCENHKPRIKPYCQFNTFARLMETTAGADAIWRGQEVASMTDDEQVKLVQKILDKFINVHGPDASSELRVRAWWDRLIARGGRLKLWTIPVLPLRARIAPAKPVLARSDFGILDAYREIEDGFWSILKAGIPDDKLAPAAFVSAMLCSRLAAQTPLLAISRMTAACVRSIGAELGVRLQTALPGSSDLKSEQVWHVDCVTATLLARWINTTRNLGASDAALYCPFALSSAVKEGQQLHRTIDKALASLGLPEMSASDFLRGVQVSQMLEAPGYLVNYRCNERVSQSLPWEVISRINGLTAKDDSSAAAGAGDAPEGSAESSIESIAVDLSFAGGVGPGDPAFVPMGGKFDYQAESDVQYFFLKKVQAKLTQAGDAVKDVKSLINSHASQLWPITSHLAYWILWRRGNPLIEDDPTSGIKPVEESSVLRYLSAIGHHLLAVVGMENLLDSDVEDVELSYEQAATRVRSAQELPVFWRCIRSFHTFLMLHGMAAVAFEELDGYSSSWSGPSVSNVVTEEEFEVFKRQALHSCNGVVDCPSMQVLLVAVLGFRCGLRRREVQMLLTHHILAGREPWIAVRENILATLKSRSASRRLPLYILLPADEKKLLIDYFTMRREKLGGKIGLLFCQTDTPMVPLSQHLLFDPVTQCFQQILGSRGPAFRFHHFRHSFSNRIFLLLLAADTPELLQESSRFLSHCGIDAERAFILKDTIFPRMPGAPRDATGKILYLTSYLLGHLSPQTTLRYYLHFLDWLSMRHADLHLADKLAEFSGPELTELCSLSSSMARSSTYAGLRDDPVAFLHKFVSIRLPSDLRLAPAKAGGVSQLNSRTGTAGEPINLSGVFAKLAKVRLATPTEMMLALNAALAILDRAHWCELAGIESAFSRLQRNHCIAMDSLYELCLTYRRLFDRRKSSSDRSTPVEGAPHYILDRQEFWRILTTTTNAFGNAKNRESLRAASRALIDSRNSPQVSTLRFDKSKSDILLVAQGLECMGIPRDEMMMEVRVAAKDEIRPEVSALGTQCATWGLTVKNTSYAGDKCIRAGGVVSLTWGHPNNSLHKGQAANRWSVKQGQTQGLNFGALWVVLAQAATTARQS